MNLTSSFTLITLLATSTLGAAEAQARWPLPPLPDFLTPSTEQIDIEQAPWQAEVLVDGESKCGAAILNHDWLITSASCLHPLHRQQYFDLSALEVVVGDRQRGQDTSTGEIRQVEKFVTHPSYRFVDKKANLALIKIKPVDVDDREKGLVFSSRVQPIAVGTHYFGSLPQLMKTSGWGPSYQNDTSLQFPYLQQSRLRVLDRKHCQGHIALGQNPFRNGLFSDEFCLQSLKSGFGSCGLDDGAPVARNQKLSHASNRLLGVAGINKYGPFLPPQCPSATIVTELKTYIPWIEAVAGKTPLPGDLNGDRCVDADDFSLLFDDHDENFTRLEGDWDVDQDGRLGDAEWNFVIVNWKTGEGCPIILI